jgi:hypothetical protein
MGDDGMTLFIALGIILSGVAAFGLVALLSINGGNDE